MLQSKDTLDTEALCGVRYDWLSRQDVRDAAIAEWESLVGGPVQVVPIAGNHFEPFIDDKVRQIDFRVRKYTDITYRSPKRHHNFGKHANTSNSLTDKSSAPNKAHMYDACTFWYPFMYLDIPRPYRNVYAEFKSRCKQRGLTGRDAGGS